MNFLAREHSSGILYRPSESKETGTPGETRVYHHLLCKQGGSYQCAGALAGVNANTGNVRFNLWVAEPQILGPATLTPSILSGGRSVGDCGGSAEFI